ncbi:MAG: dTDP-4-dehydrorhamnose 3,5-epimerase [Verrucomicrobiota bacterium]
MKFSRTAIDAVWIIELERREDERGFFARTWCRNEFASQGLKAELVQCSTSLNLKRGTLRGMHYQAEPHPEAKLIRCTRGAIYDVALDLRTSSPTFRQWVATELTAENGRMLYIGEGLAHGFQTLIDETEVFYQMTEYFHPECARGVRWNDPSFAIHWPHTEHRLMSDRDASYPDFA